MFHVLSIFSCCLRPIFHLIVLETSSVTREYFEQTLFAVRDVEFPFANKCKLQLVDLNLLL